MACAPATRPTPPAPTPVPAVHAALVQLPASIHWARNSAEHRALYLQIYRAAGERLTTVAAARPAGTWGVILDADETIIDNSEYEKSRVPYGGAFDAAAWNRWVMERRAPALPGAVAFTARVHELGGKVVVVTNRDEAQCDVTRQNFRSDGFAIDLVLCKGATGDKNPRFDAVANGTAAPGFPAIAVLEWLGDNIQDFPHLSQQIRDRPDAAFAKFGDSYFAFPDPMYGSWESNPGN